MDAGRASEVLIVVSGSAQDALGHGDARALIRAFEGVAGTIVATTAPQFVRGSGRSGREDLLAALEPLAAALKARDFRAVVIADEQAALRALPFLRARTTIPIAVLLGQTVKALPPDLADVCHKASRIWLTGLPDQALPPQLRARTARLPRALSGADPALRREARRLLDGPRPPRAADYPLSSIIIPVHNALPFLKRCVKSIRRNTAAPYELILVDNASDAPTREYVKSVAGARRIYNPVNRGFAPAINQGMKLARGRYLVWTNSDLIMTPGWLERMIDCAQSDESVGAVGPLTNRTVGLQVVEVPAGLDGKAGAWQVFASALAQRHARQWHEVHRLAGFCVLLKRRVYAGVGQLDERFATGCYEDFDYSLRIRQAGWRLALAKDVFVYHHAHASFGTEEKFYEHALSNRELFIDKWCRKALEFLDEVDPVLKSPAGIA